MYSTWRISELKGELEKRGASLKGRKIDFIERLKHYDRNFNSESTGNQSGDDLTMKVPDVTTYQDIDENSLLPPLSTTHIRHYFCFDDKTVKKTRALYESRFLLLAKMSVVGDITYIKGFCNALQYEVNIKIGKNGMPLDSICKCPAGSEIEAKCKHVAVLLHGVEDMVHHKIMLLHQVCSETLQNFHVPEKHFTALPIHQLHRKKIKKRFCPFPVTEIDKSDYNTKFRDLVLNFSNSTMPIKQLYPPANPHSFIIPDHTYSQSV